MEQRWHSSHAASWFQLRDLQVAQMNKSLGQKQTNQNQRGATEATSFIPTHNNRIRVYLWPAVFSNAAKFQNNSNEEASERQHK